jgi:hypothetical protein
MAAPLLMLALSRHLTGSADAFHITHHQRNRDPPSPPTKLNTPPVKPINRVGASDDTIDQVMEAKPLPKIQN